MSIVLGFLPFIVFAVASRWVTSASALWIAFAAAVVILASSRLRGRAIKILEIGSVALFGAIAIGSTAARGSYGFGLVRLCVDGGLWVIALVSIIVRQPFTLQYAREQTEPTLWDNPMFLLVNYRISCAWMASFAASAMADAALVYWPRTPAWVDVAIGVASLACAAWFTTWYTRQVRSRAALPEWSPSQ